MGEIRVIRSSAVSDDAPRYLRPGAASDFWSGVLKNETRGPRVQKWKIALKFDRTDWFFLVLSAYHCLTDNSPQSACKDR